MAGLLGLGGAHAPLQRLNLQVDTRRPTGELASEVQRLRHSRPALAVETDDGGFWQAFHE